MTVVRCIFSLLYPLSSIAIDDLKSVVEVAALVSSTVLDGFALENKERFLVNGETALLSSSLLRRYTHGKCYNMTEYLTKKSPETWDALGEPDKIYISQNAIELIFNAKDPSFELPEGSLGTLGRNLFDLYTHGFVSKVIEPQIPMAFKIVEFDDQAELSTYAKEEGMAQAFNRIIFVGDLGKHKNIFTFMGSPWANTFLPLSPIAFVSWNRLDDYSKQKIASILTLALSVAELYNIREMVESACFHLELSTWRIDSLLNRFIETEKIIKHYIRFDEKKLVFLEKDAIESLTPIIRRQSPGGSKIFDIYGEPLFGRVDELLNLVNSHVSEIPYSGPSEKYIPTLPTLSNSLYTEIKNFAETSTHFTEKMSDSIKDHRDRLQLKIGMQRLYVGLAALAIAILGLLIPSIHEAYRLICSLLSSTRIDPLGVELEIGYFVLLIFLVIIFTFLVLKQKKSLKAEKQG